MLVLGTIQEKNQQEGVFRIYLYAKLRSLQEMYFFFCLENLLQKKFLGLKGQILRRIFSQCCVVNGGREMNP